VQLLVAWQPAQLDCPWHAGQVDNWTELPAQITPLEALMHDDQLPEHQAQPGSAVHCAQLSPTVQPAQAAVGTPPVMAQFGLPLTTQESPGGPSDWAPSHQMQPRIAAQSWQEA